MNKNRTKLFFRKRIRKTKQNAEVVQEATVNTVDKHVVRRWGKLRDVRRFVIGWLALVLILSLGVWLQGANLKAYYSEETPAYGGTYFEGLTGKFTSLNPIFAVSSADSSVAKLTFSSLLKYDNQNELVGDLATAWSVDKDEVVYTVILRDDVYWHDGEKFTADDVVFTYQAIQQPETKSPLADSWKGIEIQAVDDYTVSFSLPNPYTPFLHSLTNGIIPRHLLSEVPYSELRSNKFNLEPIGSGPFVFDRLIIGDEISQAILVRNENYYAGTPYLKEFVVEAYSDHEQMLNAFKKGELSAATALRTFELESINEMKSSNVVNFPLFNQVFIFLNNSDPLLKDSEIRRALSYATDRRAVFAALDSNYPISDSSLIRGQLGYDDQLTQPKHDAGKANEILDKAGWKKGEDGIRTKGDQRLEINIVSQGSDEYPIVLSEIQKSWGEVGIATTLDFIDEQDFTSNNVAPHNYQALAFGITQGVSPDVFVYWHSSQAVKNGFNFSNYKSAKSDIALEAGRTRSDPGLREEKYKTFLEEWINDNPAIALYRPVFNYALRGSIKGVIPHDISTPIDRFNNVVDWSKNTELTDKEL